MTRGNGSYTANPTTNAAVKTMYQPISNLLNSVFTRTADSGQVNWATYSTVSSFYEIFAFNDAAQATAPLYLKVDYLPSYPNGINFSLGTATTGAGVLTAGNILQAAVPIETSSRPVSAVGRFWYGSGDGSYFTLQMNLQATATSTAAQGDSMAAIVIERTRDADGTPNGNGVCMWQWQASLDALSGVTTNGSFQCFRSRYYGDATTSQPAISYDYAVQMPNVANNPSYAGSNATAIFPALTQAGPILGGASKAFALAYTADVPKQTVFSATHYGASSQWIAMGNATPATVPYTSTATAAAIKGVMTPCFRWE